jgi:hypothetical protein
MRGPRFGDHGECPPTGTRQMGTTGANRLQAVGEGRHEAAGERRDAGRVAAGALPVPEHPRLTAWAGLGANWLVIRGDVQLADSGSWSFEDACLTT